MTAPSPGRRRARRLLRAALGAAALAAASAPLHAEDYRFIVSGWPAADESYAASSAAVSLETATRRGMSAASPLEARSRTRDASAGVALRSDRFNATMIFFR